MTVLDTIALLPSYPGDRNMLGKPIVHRSITSALAILLGMSVSGFGHSVTAAQPLPVVTDVEQQPLVASSPQAAPQFRRSRSASRPKHTISPADAAGRFLDIVMYNKRPLNPRLSGLALEYRIIQLFSRDAGKREAQLAFDVCQGTQDIGFRNAVAILFRAVDVCWNRKKGRIRDAEKPEAQAAYDKARHIYDRILTESVAE